MTFGATWVSGGVFLKRYPSEAAAETARRRSAAACDAGVPTPAVLGEEGPRALWFERIKGQVAPTLGEMIRAVTLLNALPTNGLARLDPFLRIQPRIALATPRIRQLIDDMRALDAALQWPANAVVHGDFHPRQVMRDEEGRVWLVDLDDLALAPHEADLGNLAAWLATQTPGDLNDLAAHAVGRVLDLAQAADPMMMRHFFEIALVRRALKLQENAVNWVVEQLPLRA
ncbi:MAG: phosphotransferase family protein [Paracoccaceae bacterium]